MYDYRCFGCPKCIACSFGSDKSDGFCGRELHWWLLGAALTELPGSSCYFLGGIQAYANEVKEGLLGVSHETLLSFGAVSEEVASEMANGIQRLTGSDWAISTTGVAGPDGGTDEKPVGTVWISVVGCDGLFSQKLELDGDRTNVRQDSVP